MKTVLRSIVASLAICSSSFAQVAAEEPKQPPKTERPAPTPIYQGTRAADVEYQRATAQRGQAEAARAAAEADLAYTKTAFANWKQKLEKGSYLGIATSPIPTVLRDQLKLEKGVGLVVDRVDAQSPAEAAGIKPSDVIQKLDDQLLINPNQFGVLVRTLKPDVEVKLTLIRETKPQTVALKPVEKDLTPLDEPMGGYGGGNKRTWTETMGGFGGATGGRLTITAPGGGAEGTRAEVFTMNNDNMTLTTTVDGKGQKHLTALDKATGKILYDNTIDDAQMKDLPPEVAEQVKAMKDLTIARPVRVVKGNAFMGGGGINLIRGANNLPRVKAVSGSDDDYTWDLTTKTNEAGKPELDLLLLDKNGNKLFDGPFSRTKNMKELPAQISERLGSYPWDLMIEDLKNAGGGGNVGVINFAPAVGAAPPAPRAAPAK